MRNPTFEERLASARTSQEIRDICTAERELRMPGVMVRDRDGNTSFRQSLVPAEAQARPVEQQSEPQDGSQLLRRAVTVGNTTHLLEAYSVHGLDILERAFREQH